MAGVDRDHLVLGMIYAIMNRNIVRNHYLGKGWSAVSEGQGDCGGKGDW